MNLLWALLAARQLLTIAAFVASPPSWPATRLVHSTLPPRLGTPPLSSVSTSVDGEAVVKEPSSPPTVQRVYETYRWKCSSGQKDNRDNDDVYYNINYRCEGPADGPPILLVHGFGANVNHFRYQFPDLVKAGYRVYAVDLLGFGASDKPATAPYSIELFSQLLQDFMLAMHPEQSWRVAGNSIGGLCALQVTTNLPERVKGVVLFNCAGGMTGFRYEDVPWFIRPILYFVQNFVIKGPIGPAFFANFRTRENVESILRQQGVYGDPTNVDEELLEILLGPADDPGACDVFLNVFGGPPGPTPGQLLPYIQCPILALWGESDPWTPFDKGAHPATGLPNDYFATTDAMEEDVEKENGAHAKDPDFFQLEVFAGAGHCPHDEVPGPINAKLIEWMQEMDDRYTPTKS